MAETRFFMLQVRTEADLSSRCTLSEVAYRAGLHPELIERFVRLGLIDFCGETPDGEPLFDFEVIPVIRRIIRLRNDLGVNYAGIGVILELLSRLEALEAAVRDLEARG